MTDFIELSEEEYAALTPIAKAHYKRRYNSHHGIVTVNVSKDELRKAIRDMCISCCESTVEVKECHITKCPLWKHRPYQSKQLDSNTDIGVDE